MRKKLILFLLAVLLLALACSGCGEETVPEATTLPPETTEATVPATVPADGDPGDVTCKGSYSVPDADPDGLAATVGDHSLTNEELQVWYWMAVAERQQGSYDAAPDFSRPLDTQPCPIDDSVNSWQQYFLKQALNTWHSVYALELQAREQPLPTEEAYKPNLANHEKYLVDIPATDYLYGHNPLYQPNSMHDAYLTALPETLEALAQEKGYAGLEDMARQEMGVTSETLLEELRMYNYAYMYFTTLSYYIESSEQDVSSFMVADGGYADTGRRVDIRQILLVPDGETESDWAVRQVEAEELLEYWQRKTLHTEATFANLANEESEDTGSALNGGAYRNIRQGQLTAELDVWCFDEARKPGDTTILRTAEGWHILYFSGSTGEGFARAKKDLTERNLQELVELARSRYPAEIFYSDIALADGAGTLDPAQVLYPDIAHERFPEVPLYLQQDYPSTMYGGFKITTNGCGITTMAMLATYMADDELTPPEMCDRYGRYSMKNGTDGMIFVNEPAAMGFYHRETTYDSSVAKAALQEGQIVVSLQHKGYWTRGGHYIVLEKIDEDNMVQVRDSNIYNYGKIEAHLEDLHTWGSIINNGSGFWIFEDKVTAIPACSRCGDPEGQEASPLEGDYLCEKCTPALLRRNAFLNIWG